MEKRSELWKKRKSRTVLLYIFFLGLMATGVSCGKGGQAVREPKLLGAFGQNWGAFFAEEGSSGMEGGSFGDFDEYCQEVFAELLEDNAFWAHFIISDPLRYELEYEPEDYVVEARGLEEMQNEAQYYLECLEELETFDRGILTREQQLTYDTLVSYMGFQGAYAGVENLTNYFAPEDSILGTLVINFEEFAFNDQEDVRQYLSFLKSFYPYIQQCLEFTRQQADAGYFMSDEIADRAIEACREHYNKDEAVLRASFENKLESIPLEEDMKNSLLEQNEEYLKKYYLPACQEAASVLTELKGTGKNEGGLWGYGEAGRQYYTALLQEKTSSKITPEELAGLLDQKIAAWVDILSEISADERQSALEYQPDFGGPDEMIRFLLEHMGDDFPAPATTSYQIGNMSKTMEESNLMAYYTVCKIDDVDNNSIKINNSAIGRDTLGTYMAIAHEAFPGHMYLHTALSAQEGMAEIRKILDFLGADEGWAKYAEENAIDYLEISSAEQDVLLINNLLPYLLIARADIGVNYEGWSLEETRGYLLEYLDVDAEDFYYSVVGTPGQYFPYAAGYLKMSGMRELAEQELGEQFDVLAYHQWIGGLGITSFDVYEERLTEWIEVQKAEGASS